MHDRFTYLTVTGSHADARAAAARVRDDGGVVVGTFAGAGGIGWWDDEWVVLGGWPVGSAPASGHGEHLHATARPTEIAPLEPGGVFAHRWFETDAPSWEEFLQLSTEAWPAFERAYGATIEGFFRSDDVAEPDARVLLVTRYPSVAAWDASRGALRDPDSDAAEAGRRFLRRRELTRRSIVRLGLLV